MFTPTENLMKKYGISFTLLYQITNKYLHVSNKILCTYIYTYVHTYINTYFTVYTKKY